MKREVIYRGLKRGLTLGVAVFAFNQALKLIGGLPLFTMTLGSYVAVFGAAIAAFLFELYGSRSK